MIEISKLNKFYGSGTTKVHVLKDIDLTIKQGEMVSIMGSSGSGKTTLLNMIGVLDSYNSGEYYLSGKLTKDLSEVEAAKLRNEDIGFIFQSFHLISNKNALENVALPLFYRNIGRKKRNAIAQDYLSQLGVSDYWDHLPSELSGGQKQRVAVARALIARPKIILADEPTGALDTQTSYELMNVLSEINKFGITQIIVTHEKDIVDWTNRIIYLKDGRIEANN